MTSTWKKTHSHLWSRRGLVAAVAALLVAPALSAFAIAADNSPKAFLDGIYGKYVGSPAQGASGIPLDSTGAIRRYFSPGLARLMLEDEANAKKKNEVPTLDGDPFVGHQDWAIAELAVAVKQSGPSKATGTVTFTNFGKAETVVVELLNAGEGWRIADIRWPDGTLRELYRKK